MKSILKWIRSNSYWFLVLLLSFAFVLGMIGFTQDGNAVDDAIFNTFTMYFLNYTDTPPNIFLSIGRDLAAVFTVVAILSLVEKAVKTAWIRIKALSDKSVFIYGNTIHADQFAETVGFWGIRSDNEFMNAAEYVLLGSEEDNLAFYSKYEKELSEKRVFIMSNSFAGKMLNCGKHRFFSLEELIARRYWKEHSLLEQAFDDGNQIKEELHVVILDFDSLGEELVYQGLQTNIFDSKQRVIYHIFGDSTRYQMLHKNLAKLNVVTYTTNWYEEPEVLESADRILITGSNVIRTINELELLGCGSEADVFTDLQIDQSTFRHHRSGVQMKNVNILNYISTVCTVQDIINEDTITMAKQLNYAYTTEEDPTEQLNPDLLWENDDMDSFSRYSNLSAVDYYYIWRQLISKWGFHNYMDCIDRLAELEHIRWCNYHFYNNWSYCNQPDPEQPDKSKNPKTRQHRYLLPYDMLAADIQEKDKNQIRTIISL